MILSSSPSSDDSDPEMVTEEPEEEEEGDEVEILSPPSNTASSSSPAAPTAALYGSKCTPTVARKIAVRFQVPPEYGLCAPSGDQRAHNPPPGYAAIYADHFSNGLRLPLPPFLATLLANYGIALGQLHPNCIVTLLGFLSICRRLSISPTMNLFRYFFRLQKSSPETEGWYTFMSRGVKIVYGQSVSMRRWKSSFLFFKTAPVTENPSFSWSWNFSPITDPQLAEHERPSEEIITMFEANVVVRKKSRQSGEEERKAGKGIKKAATEMQAEKSSKDNEPSSTVSADPDFGQGKVKRMAEVYATKPAKVLKGPTGKKKCVDGSSQLPSVPGLKDLTAEQFARFIQKSVCSFNLQLQGEKEELEKVVEAKDQHLKERDNTIASLQGSKEKLEKENALLKSEVSKLQDLVDDRGQLLRVYTWKLLKTEGFSGFFYKLTTSAKRLARHEVAELMRDCCPDIPEEALEDLEDPLAGLKLDHLFYGMIQDDAFEFPLLNHLLSLKEVPSSSELKDLSVDADPDALVAPSPLPLSVSSED